MNKRPYIYSVCVELELTSGQLLVLKSQAEWTALSEGNTEESLQSQTVHNTVTWKDKQYDGKHKDLQSYKIAVQ